MRLNILLVVLSCFCFGALAQSKWYNQQWSEGEINLEIKKILNPKKVLYLAAHPDDENTRLISFLENVWHVDVAYLSLTNGSGGQNLISKEIGEDLGLIREQELLAARREDGGEQFFTRAKDFGYSKSYEETFANWGKESILKEVVERIRIYQPDVIITRFAPYLEGLRGTHGHHTASAVLALEAFKICGDKKVYPEQLEDKDAWQPKAIFWNSSWWSYGGKERLDSIVKSNPEKFQKIQIEEFVEELGLTNSEIASKSRSMHKSQGFGTRPYYGKNYEYLELLGGDVKVLEELKTKTSPSADYKKLLNNALYATSSAKPSLLKAAIEAFEEQEQHGVEELNRIKQLYLKSINARIFINSSRPVISAGNNEVSVEVMHFSKGNLALNAIKSGGQLVKIDTSVDKGVLYKQTHQLSIKSVNEHPTVSLVLNEIVFDFPLVYRTSDPVKGEVIQRVYSVNKATIELSASSFKSINNSKQELEVLVTAYDDIILGDLHLLTNGEIVSAKSMGPMKPGDFERVTFDVTNIETADIEFEMPNADKVTTAFTPIKHDHIPWVYKSKPATIEVSQIKAESKAKKVAYVAGAGDKVPDAVEGLGATIDLIDYKTISEEDLGSYDAVMFGIRALNVNTDMDKHIDKFYSYTSQGGVLIMQYNTSHRLKTNNLQGLKLSRDRVTEEDAIVSFDTADVILNYPNKITERDFDNWVQERGLYFPSQWSDDFKAPLSMADNESKPLEGSLLYKKLGEGYFVYTGISLFRELPAGVPGAYKLLGNMLSLGN